MDKDREQEIVEQLKAGTFEFDPHRDGVPDIREFVTKVREAAGVEEDDPDSAIRSIEAGLMDAEFLGDDPNR